MDSFTLCRIRTDSLNNRIYMKPLLFLILLITAGRAEPHLPPGTKALPSAALKGRGPLALVNLNHHVLGHARVFGGKQPDLFVAGYGGLRRQGPRRRCYKQHLKTTLIHASTRGE